MYSDVSSRVSKDTQTSCLQNPAGSLQTAVSPIRDPKSLSRQHQVPLLSLQPILHGSQRPMLSVSLCLIKYFTISHCQLLDAPSFNSNLGFFYPSLSQPTIDRYQIHHELKAWGSLAIYMLYCPSPATTAAVSVELKHQSSSSWPVLLVYPQRGH